MHIQLTTATKLFCADAAHYGAAANEHTSAITLGHPGTMPRVNGRAIEQAVTLGLALGCSITQHNYFARKHYLYPDLPKGFQTTQTDNPICVGGTLSILSQGETLSVAIHHIHLEEDAGKSIHDTHPSLTAIDYNRAGTPLCELVTEPCITSSQHAYAFVTELRKLVRWVGISDGNMEEGSLRCDANISLKPKGSSVLGTRVEVKNLNSIRNIKNAIDYEVIRLAEILNTNGIVQQETRGYDADRNTTFTLRNKEDANDYRYFTEPDLAPTIVNQQLINRLQLSMPALPAVLVQQFVSAYQLSLYDATLLTDDIDVYNFFTTTVALQPNTKAIANYINGPIKQYCNAHNVGITEQPISPHILAQVLVLINTEQINFSIASAKLFPLIVKHPSVHPSILVQQYNLGLQNNTDELATWVQLVLTQNEVKVAEYKKGKKGLLGFFVGEIAKLSKGTANPQAVKALLVAQLGK